MEVIDKFFQNVYVMTALKVLVIIYGARLSPGLPSALDNLFTQTWFKILGIAVIIWLSYKDFPFALIMSIVFVLGINFVSGRSVLESYADYSPNYVIDNPQKLIEPKSNLYPGCVDLTMNDLLQYFSGDPKKLQDTLGYTYQQLEQNVYKVDSDSFNKMKDMAYYIGLPHNVDLTKNENAPLIATYLLMAGYNFTDSCSNPHDNVQNPNLTLNPTTTVSPNDFGQTTFSDYPNSIQNFSSTQ